MAAAQDVRVLAPAAAVAATPDGSATPAGATPAPGDATTDHEATAAAAQVTGVGMPPVRTLFKPARRPASHRHARQRGHPAVGRRVGGTDPSVRLPDHRALLDLALATVLGPGKVIGGFAVQFGGAWAAYGLGQAIRHERTAVVGADLMRAQLVNMIFTQGLKLSVNRTRPDGDDWSFPSGHSSGTFANAAVLHRHFGWKVGAPANAVATYVAASRLQANRHVASDVIFGAGIGLVSGRAVTVGRGRQRFALAPMPVPGGGAGIAFTRID